MDQQAKFTFINGPTVKSVGSKDDRSSVRSWFLRRTFEGRRKAALEAGTGREKKPPKSSRKQQTTTKKEKITKGNSNSVNELMLEGATNIFEDSAVEGTEDTHHVGTKSPPAPLLFWGNPRSDPFAQNYVPGIDNHYDRLIDHCTRILWPGFRRVDSYPAQFYRTWVHQSLQAPHLLNSLLFCASNHAQTLTGRGLCPREEQLRYRGRALESLRAVITKRNNNMEALVMSILFLSFNDGMFILERTAGTPNPFTPPLQNLQWLDNYAFREIHPLHWAAVQSLVSQLGGIQELKSFSLPWLLSFASLLKSSKDTSKPLYPLFAPDGRPFIYSHCIALVEIELPFKTTRPSGFRYFSELGLPASMWQVFVDLSRLSDAIRAYHSGCSPLVEADRIADCRNLIQHRLLCLPRSRDECYAQVPTKDISDVTLYLFLACCSTALLYSTHVTFPIPCPAFRRAEAITDLQKWLKLASSNVDSGDSQALRILLWCAVISGIAAKNDLRRFWAAAEVSQLSALLELNNWVECRHAMQSFCWMEQACDVGGQELWKEAEACSIVAL